jgi:hypothetical protein
MDATAALTHQSRGLCIVLMFWLGFLSHRLIQGLWAISTTSVPKYLLFNFLSTLITHLIQNKIYNHITGIINFFVRSPIYSECLTLLIHVPLFTDRGTGDRVLLRQKHALDDGALISFQKLRTALRIRVLYVSLLENVIASLFVNYIESSSGRERSNLKTPRVPHLERGK